MTNKRIKIIVIIAFFALLIYKCYAAYTQALHENDIGQYSFSAERFMAENGFKYANDFANEVYGEFFCNAMGFVYEDALLEYDLPARTLSVAIFCSSETQNHLYLYYAIPLKAAGTTQQYYFTTLEMRNISRDQAGVYHCTEIYLYTNQEDALEVVNDAFINNAEQIYLDASVRRQIDYGILYNTNVDFYNTVYEQEKYRLTQYLFSVQAERGGNYSFSTHPEINGVENVGSYIIDIEDFFVSEIPNNENSTEEDISENAE